MPVWLVLYYLGLVESVWITIQLIANHCLIAMYSRFARLEAMNTDTSVAVYQKGSWGLGGMTLSLFILAVPVGNSPAYISTKPLQRLNLIEQM